MRKLILATLIAAFASGAAIAATATDVEAKLRSQYPQTTITFVRESPLKGIYEVVMGKNIAYTNADARYVVFGHLFDMTTQEDLSAATLEASNRIDVSRLPQGDAIKVVRGKGERTLYVFSDPDCPYCKRLEAALKKVENVTIYTFPMPLAGLHPDAVRKSRDIWCAKDRAKAWDDFMLSGTLPAEGNCDTPIDRNVKLGTALGINGTPSIIFANGTMAPGALPTTELERRLNQVKGAN